MRKADSSYAPRMKLLAAASLLALAAQAQAQDADADAMARPSSWVSAGAAGVSGDKTDRSLFGQYNGLRKDDAYLMLDLGMVKRDDATGTWTIVEGRDLGLDTRELRFTMQRQGDWKVYGEYSGLVRYYPRTVNSSLQGSGTTTPIVSLLPATGTGSDIDLKTERKKLSMGGEKWFGRNLMVEAHFTTEDKDGARLYGRGFTCPSGAAPTPVCTALASGANQWAILMLPEPISSTTRQIEAKVNYMGERFSLTGAYYGSFYNNDHVSLDPTVSGNLNNPLGNPMGQNGSVELTSGLRGILQMPMALPPDNQAHQFYVSGHYAFAPTTRATFKFARTHATQDQDFGSAFPDAPAGRTNLGGVLDTTLAQAGVTARPWRGLSLLANARYEDREDKTPIDLYNIEGTNRWTNGHISNKKVNGKVEAGYALPWSLRATVGADYESIDRGMLEDTDQVAGLSGLRQETTEKGIRAELRRTMSDTFSGAVSVSHSARGGSSWLKLRGGATTGAFEASGDCASATVNGVPNECIWSRTGIFPYMLMDRSRDKVKVLGDWSPLEALSLQFAVEHGRDGYNAPSEKGLKDTGMQLYSLDAAYTLASGWQLTAYYSYSEQTLHVSHSTAYIAELKDKNTTAGIGFKGNLNPRLKLGGELLYISDRNVYGQTLDSGASAANIAFLAQSGGLPDVTFRDTRLKLYGAYALQKNADIKVEVVHDRSRLDEWTWAGFVYSDNTTLTMNPNQRVTFVSVVYSYRWR